MHDPYVVAFEIKSPFKRKSRAFPYGRRPSLVTIWHRDPEKDGGDDSCGWTYPRLTDAQRKVLRSLAWSEARDPWFQKLRAKRNEDHVYAESLMRGAVLQVARALDVTLDWGQVSMLACRLIHSPMDHFRGGLCHLPGYHTNFPEDDEGRREETAEGLFRGIARQILRDRRPWWRHPRWHLHHWRIQVHPYQALRRWLFTRCDRCGGRFGRDEPGLKFGDEVFHFGCKYSDMQNDYAGDAT